MPSGLVDSFLGAFQGLMDMERQKKQDQQMQDYRKQEVALRKQEIEAQRQNAQAITAHRNFMEQLDLQRLFRQEDADKTRADTAAKAEAGRDKRADEAEKGREGRSRRTSIATSMRGGESLRSAMEIAGDAPDDITAALQKIVDSRAPGVKASNAATAGQNAMGAAGPVVQQVLSALMGAPGVGPKMGEQKPLQAMPTVESVGAEKSPAYLESEKEKEARMKKLAADTEAAVVRKKVAEQALADHVANETIDRKYKENRVKIQEERLKNMPLESTAKRLQIDLDKLRIQKTKGEIEFQAIHTAIERIKQEKDRRDAHWNEDAKATRSWLEKEYSTANSDAEKAQEHLTHLTDALNKSDAIVSGLAKQKNLQAADQALLDEERKRGEDLRPRVQFYQQEHQRYINLRDGAKNNLDKMMGLGLNPMTDHGSIDRKAVRKAQSTTTLPPIKGLDQSKQILGKKKPVISGDGWSLSPK